MSKSQSPKSSAKPLVVSYLRFSTGKQSFGDSERRQLEAADKWLEKNGYEVKEDFILKDKGKSAFHSENFSDDGALGKFINQVKKGDIAKGTILLIEDFSRFSRAQINLAQQKFLELINNGIRVYVVKDDKLYEEENYSFEDMIVSLAKMASAHEESDRKSNHLKSVWAEKRKNAYQNKNIDEYPLLLPTSAPDWIKKVKKGSQTYLELMPERVLVIKHIFELADVGGKDGLGLGSSIIVRTLESKGIKPFKGERRNTAITFTDSYVVRLLKDRRLLGYLQPYTNPIDPDTGKRIRVKDGDEIPNYFPPVIDQETFNRVREKIEQRKLYSSGKVSRKFSNIFTKIVKCAKCGHSMTMYTKRGAKAEGGRSVYLQCSEGTKHRKCGNKAVRYYDTFEKTIINSLIETDLSSLFQSNNEQSDERTHKIREQIYELTKEVEKLDKTIITATQMYFENPDDQFFKKTRMKVINDQSNLKAKLDELNQQLLQTRSKSNYEDFKSNLETVLLSQNLNDDIETYTMRKAINTYLIDILQYIAIDGDKQDAWVVFDKGFVKQQIKGSAIRGQKLLYQAHMESDFEKYFPTPLLFDKNGVGISGRDHNSAEPSKPLNKKEINSFGTRENPYFHIKLQRFKDVEPTYEDILKLRTGYDYAPKELIIINDICNQAINRNWKMKKRLNYEVLSASELDELQFEVAEEMMPDGFFDE